jgi:hypothetical protein
MNCPLEIAQILLDILEQAVLQTRAAGWAGDPVRAAMEADHIHNLPDLLRHYSPDLLAYYWNAQRVGYIAEADRLGVGIDGFAPLWERLRPYIIDAGERAITK